MLLCLTNFSIHISFWCLIDCLIGSYRRRRSCLFPECNGLELVAFLVFDFVFESFVINCVHGRVVLSQCLILDELVRQSLTDQLLVFHTDDGAVPIRRARH